MGKVIYGVKSGISGSHIDISYSLKATKRLATMRGYSVITSRHTDHYYVDEIFKKVNGEWVRI